MRRIAAIAALVGLLSIGGAAHAASITFNLDFEFSGADEPQSLTLPWVTGTIDDSLGGLNTVRLTMSADNLIDTESIANFFLNFDPSLDASLLTYSVIDNSASVPNSISFGNNLFLADGDGNFDINFDFPPPPGNYASRLTAGQSVIYDLTYVSPITASSFDYFSEMGGGQGSYLAAAQIEGIFDNGQGSGWIGAVPEPSTGLLLGLGMTLLAASRRRGQQST